MAHMTANKQAKGEEKAAGMSQMTEMMASIQKMLLEMQPQLSQLTNEVNETKGKAAATNFPVEHKN